MYCWFVWDKYEMKKTLKVSYYSSYYAQKTVMYNFKLTLQSLLLLQVNWELYMLFILQSFKYHDKE
jgi:hypothetical protein